MISIYKIVDHNQFQKKCLLCNIYYFSVVEVTYFRQGCNIMTKKKEDPRSVRSKMVLKQSLIDLLIENPDLSKLSVKNISEKAKLNRATFYLHFKDTQELLRAVVYDIANELEEKIHYFFHKKNIPSSSQFILFLDYFYSNRHIFIVLFEHARFKSKIHRVIRDSLLVSEDQVVKNFKFKTTSKDIITASLLGVIMWWITDGLDYSSEYIAKEVIALYK